MKQHPTGLARRYATSLRGYLTPGSGVCLEAAQELGQRAFALGLNQRELARMHARALVSLKRTGTRGASLRMAELFFRQTLIPVLEQQQAARPGKSAASPAELLRRRIMKLSATNLQLRRGIARSKRAEAALKRGDRQNARRLKESLSRQMGLRQLTHRTLAAQELERKQISTELQDEIAQNLLGINVRLVALKRAARMNTDRLKNQIASTRELVVNSIRAIRRAALQFRNP